MCIFQFVLFQNSFSFNYISINFLKNLLYAVNVFKKAFQNFLVSIFVLLKHNFPLHKKTPDGTRKQTTATLAQNTFSLA